MASRVMPALLTSTSTGPSFLGDLRRSRFAGGEVADVPLEHRDARLDLELLRGGVVAGVVGGDAVAARSSARSEMAWPMPRVPPVTRATRAM